MNEIKTKNVVILGIIGLFFIFQNNIASAYSIAKVTSQDNGDFVVEPGKTEIFVDAGETVTRKISVTSRTNRPLDFKVGIENFVGSDDSRTPVVLLPEGKETPYPIDEFVDLELNSFTLNFGERITFDVTVRAPQTIEPGGHYGAVVISNQAPTQFDSQGNEVVGGAKLTSRIGSLILMRVNGDVEESGYLDLFKTSGPSQLVYQSLPTSFEIAYRNTGSVHAVPYGTITIKNIFGSRIAQLPVDAFFALPQSLRYQEIVWPGRKFAFGLYTATIELNNGFNDEFDVQKIRFGVLPLIIIIPTLLGLFIILLALKFVLKRFEIKRK